MTMRPIGNKLRTGAWLVAMIFVLGASTAHAAKIVIVNQDKLTQGFNKTDPRDPVGGNQGTTLGEQRMKALQYAANMLAARIQSQVPIEVDARFVGPGKNGFDCNSNGATLAATAAAYLVSFNQIQAPPRARPSVYYPIALANALVGYDLAPDGEDIDATFNSGVDTDPHCLSGKTWYYGLDNNTPPGKVNFVSTAVHELLHGLGFSTYATLSNNGDSGICVLGLLCLPDGKQNPDLCGAFYKPPKGTEADRYPDIFSTFIRDLAGGKVGADNIWPNMTRKQRCDSVTDTGFLVWSGPSVTSAAPGLFTSGFRQGYLQLYAPDPVLPGSSISHWSTSLAPDPVMGPFDEGDIPVPQTIGIATCVLQDLGWRLAPGIRCPDAGQIADPVTADPPPLNGSGGNGASSGGGGGGGCTLAPGGPFDPTLLVVAALALLGARRRRS